MKSRIRAKLRNGSGRMPQAGYEKIGNFSYLATSRREGYNTLLDSVEVGNEVKITIRKGRKEKSRYREGFKKYGTAYYKNDNMIIVQVAENIKQTISIGDIVSGDVIIERVV